jgi:hypothetical protein
MLVKRFGSLFRGRRFVISHGTIVGECVKRKKPSTHYGILAVIDRAAHILAGRYPELASDHVSQYVARLREQIGDSRSSAVYSTACRAAPVGENPLGLQRGSVVEIEGERYVTLGCGFLTIELANLGRPGELRTVGPEDFAKLKEGGFKVLSADESGLLLDEASRTA